MKKLIVFLALMSVASGYVGGTFALALEEGSSTTIPSLYSIATIVAWMVGLWLVLRQPEKAEVRA